MYLAEKFGYGPRAGQPSANTAADLMQQMQFGAGEQPQVPFGDRRQREQLIREFKGAAKRGTPGVLKTYRPVFRDRFLEDQHARIAEAVQSPNGFFHRLLSFWSNHFAVARQKSLDVRAQLPFYETDAIRPHIGGRFADMVWAVETHTAMVLYLDQQKSVGPNSKAGRKGKGLNENLAREIMELHTLGVNGRYTQADVRALAEILTGLVWDAADNRTVFQRRRSQTGVIQFLGTTVEMTPRNIETRIRAALERVSTHPDTAVFISRKLAAHFIADTPPRDLVDVMARRFMETGGHLPSVYAELTGYAERFAPPAQKFKTPTDLIVSGLRVLNADGAALLPRQRNRRRKAAMGDMMGERQVGAIGYNPLTVGALRRLNHDVWGAPGPDGWSDERASWMTPQGLVERLLWSRRAAEALGRDVRPITFMERTLGARASESTRFAVSAAASRMEGLSLVLMSPEFNLR